METKRTDPLQFQSEVNEEGYFEGYASVFNNIDNGGDVIAPGAFKSVDTTTKGKLKIAYNHDLGRLIGYADFHQDDHGLYVKGKLSLGVSYARDVYHLMKDDVLEGMSIGFNILDSHNERRDGKPVRVIKAAQLWEASIVGFPMNRLAQVTQVKSCVESFDAYKSALLTLPGITPEQAEAAARASYQCVSPEQSKHDGQLIEQLKSIRNMIQNFVN